MERKLEKRNMANEIVATTEENKVTQDLLLDYLKTMNKGLNEQQTKQFLAVAGTFGLNPWKREVYAVTYKNKDGSTDMSMYGGKVKGSAVFVPIKEFLEWYGYEGQN